MCIRDRVSVAYLKWKPIKYHLDKAIDYVKNDLKTENGELVSSYLCSLNSKEAMLDFLQDNKMNLKSNIKAHHLIMSFSPEDKITPQKAHDLGIELCKKFLKGDRRYIISTHIDREHIHNHICLLYTSPSPRDRTRSRMPSSA